ncbi:MAG: hypothetical protein DWQ47_03040 [Acidobacteria bacterium]|nr:MAG: hypothetical protein DWQ32_06590 [Acidobacteriota bacterium]REK01379.1 MAG: hypothetical protein DWQ38_03025 [Acidobacteriota bacterium]REK14335.1 MAG: hypothetical protein DWQ43_12280 [Acidobacteriota bacterium]REK45050.1 MAG: hypothetical protein DWQ47_03040 [Acidobacteriota bacterium]
MTSGLSSIGFDRRPSGRAGEQDGPYKAFRVSEETIGIVLMILEGVFSDRRAWTTLPVTYTSIEGQQILPLWISRDRDLMNAQAVRFCKKAGVV